MAETRPRFEAVGRYVIDWDRERICGLGNEDCATSAAVRWNDNNSHDEPDDYVWQIDHNSPKKPADCPEYYWAAGVQCMEIRNAIIEAADFDKIVSSDWGHLFGYVFRMLRKGEPIKDLLKIEHFARIIRLRLEGNRK